MDEQSLDRLKALLLRQRKEIFDRLQGFESDLQALNEREIEFEEEAQKAHSQALFDQLEQRDKEKLEDIDLALAKMSASTYGRCETCLKPIPRKRLEILPATRFCIQCLGSVEKK
jgi:DnaK suppressor protein